MIILKEIRQLKTENNNFSKNEIQCRGKIMSRA